MRLRLCSTRSSLTALFVLAALGSGLQAAYADERVRLAYISDSPGSSSPFWIAKDAGLFKKHGLDAELVFINGSTRGVQSLIAGDIDFAGAVGTSAINGRLAGGDIVIVNSMVNTLPYYIIGKPEVRSPEDMKGRAAATHIPGTSADFALRLALRKFGIDYDQIRAVMVGGTTARVAAVIKGQVDYTMVTEPGKIQGEKAGLKMIVDLAALNIPFQFTCGVTSSRLIRERPDAVQRIARAMAESIHFFKNHKNDTMKIMSKYTRGVNQAVLEGTWQAYRELLVEDTRPTMEGLQDTLAVQAAWDPKAANAKAQDFVDLRFVDQLEKSGFLAKLYGGNTVSRK